MNKEEQEDKAKIKEILKKTAKYNDEMMKLEGLNRKERRKLKSIQRKK